MPDASDNLAGLKELLDTFFADSNGMHRTTVEKYVELERAMLEQYQRFVVDQMAVNDDVLQNFTKLMMTSWMQVMAFQREHRSRFLELQSTMADAHLRFLERLSDSMKTPTSAASPGSARDGE